MILIIKNGFVAATHTNEQIITQEMYPDCEIVSYYGSFKMSPVPQRDPRSDEEKKLSYQSLRKMAYPSLADQLDMLYWDITNKTGLWRESIKAVKERYPK